MLAEFCLLFNVCSSISTNNESLEISTTGTLFNRIQMENSFESLGIHIFEWHIQRQPKTIENNIKKKAKN